MSTKRISLAKLEALEPEWLRKIHIPNWIVLVLGLIFLFRIPGLFEPYYYQNEMVSLAAGVGIRQGLLLYRDIYVDNPPLLYFIAAIAGNLFWFRAILALWMMMTTVFFYKLADTLFPKKSLIVLGAVVAFAILTTIPLLEGQIANAEAFMIGPTIAAFHILFARKLTPKNLLIAGGILSLSTLFKVSSVFDIGAIIFIWLISSKPKKNEASQFIRQSVFLFLGLIIPILMAFVWYALKGGFNEYFAAVFLQNTFFTRRVIILLLGLATLYIFRKKLSSPFLFATAWLLFSLYSATLSGQPHTHYLIQVVPPLSLLIGILLASQSIEQSLSIIPICLVPLTAIYSQFGHYPSASYYQKFLYFISGQATKEEYFTSFDKNAPRNYKIAQYLLTSSGKDEKIFVWGDSSTIYALSKRLPPLKYVALHHINNLSSQEEILGQILKNKPKLIVILPLSPDFPQLTVFLQNKYILIEDIEGAKIWKAVGFSMNSLLK